MLFLTRKKGESVMVGDSVEITVIELHGSSVKLGFTYPDGTRVLRREVFDRIKQEQEDAARPKAGEGPS